MFGAGGLSSSTNDQTNQTQGFSQTFGGATSGGAGVDLNTVAIAAGAAVVIIGVLLLVLRRR